MNELALFAGAGGGLLATTHLLGWRTVAAVEIDPYRREVLLRRQRDGLLDVFPIWDDIRTLSNHAIRQKLRGRVDVVTAGFPCQPHSTAARGRNHGDELFLETIRVIKECQPTFILLENVMGVRSFLETIRVQLCDLDFCVHPPAVIPAAALGAPHKRYRYWIFAHANTHRESPCTINDETSLESEIAKVTWWRTDIPGTMGMDDGMARRVDRLSALGDGQVPAVVALAWRILTEGGDL